MCWMPVGQCCLHLQLAVGHRIQSLERIPLPFLTDNAGKVVVRQNQPLFKGFPPYNGQWQPHYNFLGHQFGKHWCSNQGESISKTHFVCCQRCWYIRSPNPSPHDEPDGPNLVHQKLSTRQAWNWILVAWNTVSCWLSNKMHIQQPDRLIRTFMFNFVFDCVENTAQNGAGIFWIENHLAIHFPMNLSCTMISSLSSSMISFSCF